MPRVLKSRDTQTARSRDMAEVFTPSWICNAQNNLIDEAWFGRREVFNVEYTDEQGQHRWTATTEKIVFPEGKTWRDYVRDTRLEITCGEAPYIVSRYDTTTGEAIPLGERIGLLDRKLRVVSENTTTSGEWLEWAQAAYKSTYGYESTNESSSFSTSLSPCQIIEEDIVVLTSVTTTIPFSNPLLNIRSLRHLVLASSTADA